MPQTYVSGSNSSDVRTPADVIRIAIIGTGVIANRHLAAIAAHERAELAGVCDLNAQLGQRVANEQGCSFYPTPEAIWSDPGVDATYLCVPNFLHYEMAAESMRHGKHVFVEKPLANTVEQCAELCRIAEETGMGLVVGHQYRFLPAMTQLKQWADGGDLGEVMVVNDQIVADYRIGTRASWFLSKQTAGHGVFLNNGVHQIDRVCWLLDEAPASILARVATAYPGRDIDSHVNAQWQMPGGQTVQVLTAGYPCAPRNSIEVIGTTGQARVDFVTGSVTLHRGMEPERAHTLTDKTHASGQMIDQIYAWHHAQTPPATGAAWGRFVVETALAHYESGRRNEPVAGPALPMRL